jgi:hypothetical protein
VHARLRGLRADSHDDYQTLLIRFALERFLYRLTRSGYADSFLVKGGMLFPLWAGDSQRPTRDLDLLGFGPSDAESLRAAITGICIVDVEDDGLEFRADTVRVEEIRREAPYGGIRVRMRASLGRSVIPIVVDIGFGDAVVAPPRPVAYPTLLPFPAPLIRPYPAESVIAEKFQAMVALGEVNSRLKDYYDIAFLCRRFPFPGATLAEALQATFDRRQTRLPLEIPPALTQAYYADPIHMRDWTALLRKIRIPAAEWSLGAVCAQIEAFLMPVAQSLRSGAAQPGRWEAGGWSTL